MRFDRLTYFGSVFYGWWVVLAAAVGLFWARPSWSIA
jgi:hypothetical protein